MRVYVLLASIFCCALLCVPAEARVFTSIDTFNDFQLPVIQTVLNGNDQTAPYDWWSPYYQTGGTGGAPAAAFLTTTSALGGQRDTILGYESVSPSGATALITIVGDSASVAFPLDYVGGGYFQWDGDDAAGGASAFPGAILNTSPGIGSGEAISNDDQTIDFTFGGRGAGLSITISADHEINYFLDAVDSLGNQNTYDFIVTPSDEAEELTFFIRFDDPIWSLSGSFDFSDVAGFQVRVLTFTGTASNNAIDTEFRFLQILGYEISGTVTLDCLCDQITAVTPVNNEQINLFRLGNPTIIDSVFTDINGDYLFNDQVLLVDGSYTVCLDNQAQAICVTTPSCVDVVLANLIDSIDNDFALTAVTSLTVPDDETVECGECTDPSCTGFAFVDGCGTGTVPLTVNDFTDSTSTDGCTITILRTWVDPDTLESGVQRIFIVDNIAPTITVQAQDRFQDCSLASTYVDWINTQAGADADDCSGFIWTPSPNAAPVRCDFETVTFTATDPCGNSDDTTATYTVSDSTAPVWNPQAANQQEECDLKTNSNAAAVNTWIATFGGASATDDCASSGQIAFSNNFSGSIASGCNNFETVTFTADDGCLNSAITVATFTILDTSDPIITVEAVDIDIDCGVSGGPQNTLDNWLDADGFASATDACIADDNLLTWSNDFTGSLGQCSDFGTVIFTVLDNCGFTASTSATYTLSDNSPPVFTSVASNLNSPCDGLGNVNDFNAWIADNAGARATDNCGTVVFTNDNVGPPINCGDFVDVTFTATDSCSLLFVSTTGRFTIVDNTPPVFDVLPQDQSSECSSTSSSEFDAWLASSAFAVISDVCSATGNFITNDFTGSTLNPGCLVSQAVRFTANDPCGNISAPEVATFTISDTLSPIISPEASDAQVECDLATNQIDYQTFLSTNGGASATDQCSANVNFSNDGTAIQSGCDNSVIVTFTANDGCNNIDVTTATFRIVDTTFPTLLTNAADLTVECNGNGNTNDLNNWLSINGGASASDSCSAVLFTNDFTALSGGCTSTAFVTFTGCDACAQCVDSSATFTIIDNSSPIINPQASSQTVECDPTSNSNAFDDFVANNGGAVASDVCEDDNDLIWTSSFTASPFGCDSEDVIFTVSDLCGRTATTSATFTIIDSVAPVITVPPANVVVECDGTGNLLDYSTFVSTQSGADAVDECAIFLVWTDNAPLTGPVGCGSEVVTFTVEDECFQSASASATYTVIDSEGPSIITPAASVTVECADSDTNLATLNTWLSTQGGAFASDSCYGTNFSWTNNFVSLNFDGCNEFSDVIFTATDPCGSLSQTTATFTITDTISPAFTSVATSEVFECDDIQNPSDVSNYLANNGNAVAIDSCSSVTFTNDFVTGPLECGPAVPVTFTATDSCGNFASSTGFISIDDTVDPTFSIFPEDIVLGCDQEIDPTVAGTPIVFDACDADIVPTFSDVDFQEPDDGFCPGDLITTRTWAAVDDCGNNHFRDQIITTVFALTSGPCTPTQCPPCELDQCCEVVPNSVQCNAVPCNVVPCVAVPCDTVPCLPNVACQDPDVQDDDDDDGLGPVPPPTTTTDEICDPVYIYVFDDDEYSTVVFNGNVDDDESSSSASSLSISLFVTLCFALVIFI